MMRRKPDEEREHEIRLRPRKPPRRGKDTVAWAKGFKLLLHYARQSTRKGTRSARNPRPQPAYSQRCAVRATYSKNRTAGQWRAHGRYLARESATSERHGKRVGFDADED